LLVKLSLSNRVQIALLVHEAALPQATDDQA
ncbi:MAG: hypothetical protein JWR06_2254, partial [Jatrophihabitans sp.]|nr:hypothetical protein [Jatrophihabitans sp.]